MDRAGPGGAGAKRGGGGGGLFDRRGGWFAGDKSFLKLCSFWAIGGHDRSAVSA